MTGVFEDNSHTIGNTPLVLLKRIAPDGAKIYAKLESRNPATSVKDRVGSNLIWDAESKGELKPGMEIVEPTSGNTGIALAYVAAARGYKVTLVMPSSMSLERRKVLKALGADIILTEPAKGMKGSFEKAKSMRDSDPVKYYMPSQFDNPANPEIHEKTTGPEIWNALEGDIDIFVAGVGTGGTLTGVSRYIKKTAKKTDLISVAVEPLDSPIISQTRRGEPITPGPHKIQGIGANFIPGNLDLSLVDDVETIANDDAIEYARRLMKEEGILSGISGGAAVAAAVRQAERHPGKKIVVIIPDSGERYLSTILFEGLFSEQDLVQ